MTEEYKKNILDYITGNITEETGVNEPILVRQDDVLNNYKNYIDTNVPGFQVFGQLTFTNSDNIVLYGNYDGTNGAIVILNNNLEPIAYMKMFSSGTSFKEFVVLKVNENNEVYGVDFDPSTSRYRFLMINNIAISNIDDGNYKVKLNKSYLFPTEYNNMYFGSVINREIMMYKKTNVSSYIFIGRNDGNQNVFTIIRLDVNVGSENTWTSKIYTNFTSTFFIRGGYCVWRDNGDTETLTYKSGVFTDDKYVELIFNGKTILQRVSIASDYIAYVDMLDLNNTYIGVSTKTNTSANAYIYKVNYTSSSLQLIDTTTFDPVYLRPSIKLKNSNGIVFIEILGFNSSYNYDAYLGVLINDTVTKVPIGTITYQGSLLGDVWFIINNFNLYKMTVLNENTAITIALDYNFSNYNGNPYTSYNSLVSNKGTLYDENGNILFSRNLYNKTIFSNTTTSIIQVPNTMLNDTNIANQKLLSTNNNEIVDSTLSIEKNIYEALFINFINILGVIDNEENIRNSTSQYINTNINVGTQQNYNNSYCSKVKVTYSDLTTSIIPVTWQDVDDTHKYIQFNINVEKEINNIELVSNDETTTYIQLNANLEVGKYYKLTQYLRIE